MFYRTRAAYAQGAVDDLPFASELKGEVRFGCEWKVAEDWQNGGQ